MPKNKAVELTEEELKNILVLIGSATIKGVEAVTVSQLQLKLSNILTETDTGSGSESANSEDK